MDQQFSEGVGANKISDGLYIGDELASKDIDTIVLNHITHIINCSATQVPNHFHTYGIQYLSFEWNDTERDVILDPHEQTISNVAAFIEDARSLGESCLIHTREGYSTSFTIFAGYFMLRFHWTLYKVLEFLNSRVPKVEIKGNCFRQLKLFEQRLAQKHPLTNDWTAKPNNPDELIIRNTYLNSMKFKPQQHHQAQPVRPTSKNLTWSAHHPHLITQENKKVERMSQKQIKSILKCPRELEQPPIKASQQSRDNSTGRKEESRDALDESRSGSNYKLSIKKKLPSANTTPPLPPSRPPEQRKVIHLVASNLARGGSEKKMEKDCPPPQQPTPPPANKEVKKQDDKISSTRNSYISRQAEHYREAANENTNQRRVLKSEMSEKENNTVESMFVNMRSEQLESKSRKQALNRSAQNIEEDPDKRLRFLTEMADMNRKEDLTKKLMRRIDKPQQANRQEKQNLVAGGLRPKHTENDQLFRSGHGGLLALNLKMLNIERDNKQPTEARRQSNDQRQIQTKKNNFMAERESEKPSSSLSKPVRAQSPCVKPSSSSILTKFKPPMKARPSERAASPMVHSQNNLSVKDANSLLGSIFSKELYKPKWKF